MCDAICTLTARAQAFLPVQTRMLLARSHSQEWLCHDAHRENGNMAQAMPMPTSKKRNSDQRMYLTRSFTRRRPRKPKAMEIITAKRRNAWKCVNSIVGTA